MGFVFFFFFGYAVRRVGILVPSPGIEPAALALKACSLNHRLPGKSPRWLFATVSTCSVSGVSNSF